jgi:homoserine kinase type II
MLHEIQQSINSADTFLAKATAKYQELQDSGLGTSPRGVIHSDLFPGHILFEYGKSTVVTVLDFEGACDGFLMFDLAATVNLWAYTKGVFKVEAMNAIIRGYNSVRALSAIESSTLVEFMEFAALYWAVWRCHYFAVVCADNSEFRDFHEYEEQLENIEHNRGQLKDQIALALDEC